MQLLAEATDTLLLCSAGFRERFARHNPSIECNAGLDGIALVRRLELSIAVGTFTGIHTVLGVRRFLLAWLVVIGVAVAAALLSHNVLIELD